MVKLSFSYESGMESVDMYMLFQALRKRGGTPMGGCEEKSTSAREGPLVLEFGGMARNFKKDLDELLVMTKNLNQEASGVEEVRGAKLGCRGSEEIVEGEPGGETEDRGQGGCHGEPLHGRPL